MIFLSSEKPLSATAAERCLRWLPAFSWSPLSQAGLCSVTGTTIRPLRRTAKNLKILLPLGSSDGPYDVRIVTPSGEELAASSGTAKLNDHITSLEVVLPRDSLQSGKYLLQLRKPQLSWV